MNAPIKEKRKSKFIDACHIYAAIVGVIVSLITIITGLFVLVKFSIIDSWEMNYKTLEENCKIQIETLNTTISQYEAKISYLEIENQALITERDKYYNYLISIPESMYYLENIISELEKKNLELESAVIPSDSLEEEKYYISYDNQKENIAIVDDSTGIVFCINEIEYSGIGHATLSLPNHISEEREVKSGDTIPIIINEKNYQIIITLLSWGTNSYSIIIKEQ